MPKDENTMAANGKRCKRQWNQQNISKKECQWKETTAEPAE
jgi:hypothetical protein